MITLTKIFHFELAHAIHGYAGACKNLHGHSYELHVTIGNLKKNKDYLPAPGFIIDFKEIKKIVVTAIIEQFDHKVLLSKQFLEQQPSFLTQENLVTWEVEPTAENMLLFIKKTLHKKLPAGIKLVRLKLFETKDSYAEWINDNSFSMY
jgi:6-pyruvoyltetrahydropterin/6-carboxytetrahydropterin synthase